MPRPYLIREYEPGLLYDWKSPEHWSLMLKAARDWIYDCDLRKERWNRINSLVYQALLHDVAGSPPEMDPETALWELQPKDPDFVPYSERYFNIWLLSWLEYCLPRDRQAHLTMLQEMGKLVAERMIASS